MGKDTLGELLMERTNLPRRAFGDDVKRVVSDTFCLDLDFVEKWKIRTENPPGLNIPMRKLLQLVGDGFRSADPYVWVRRATYSTGIFCDVRYDNEIEYLSSQGAVRILIGRDTSLGTDTSPSETCLRPLVEWFLANTTASVVRVRDVPDAPERAVRSFDWFVRNDGQIGSLQKACDVIIEDRS